MGYSYGISVNPADFCRRLPFESPSEKRWIGPIAVVTVMPLAVFGLWDRRDRMPALDA